MAKSLSRKAASSQELNEIFTSLLERLQAIDQLQRNKKPDKILGDKKILENLSKLQELSSRSPKGNNINEVLLRFLEETKEVVDISGHKGPLDLEIHFQEVSINTKNGFLFFSDKKQHKSAISLKLATRIEPDKEVKPIT